MSVTGQSVALEAAAALEAKRILRAGTAAQSAEYAVDASRALLGVSRYRGGEARASRSSSTRSLRSKRAPPSRSATGSREATTARACRRSTARLTSWASR